MAIALPSAITALVIHWAVNCGCVCYLGLVVWMLVVAGSGVRSCNFVYSGTDKLEWTLNVPGFVSRMHTRVYMGNETSQPFIPHSNPILPPMWMWLSRMHQKYSITCNIIRCVTLCCVQHREHGGGGDHKATRDSLTDMETDRQPVISIISFHSWTGCTHNRMWYMGTGDCNTEDGEEVKSRQVSLCVDF